MTPSIPTFCRQRKLGLETKARELSTFPKNTECLLSPFPRRKEKGDGKGWKGIDFDTGRTPLLITSEIDTGDFSACCKVTVTALVVSCFSECGPEDPRLGHRPGGAAEKCSISGPTGGPLSQDPHFPRIPGDSPGKLLKPNFAHT